MSKEKALIIFIKNSEAGKVKTRLAATLGNEKALAIYQQLITHTISITKNIEADKFVFYSSYINENDEWDTTFTKRQQQGNDLGEKMYNAFAALFTVGYSSINIIGSDCPGLNELIIEAAFSALKNTDVCIGPAKDGGYYLLGLKKAEAELFKNISWSTDKVLEQTLAVCASCDLSVHQLPELTDVDVEEDMHDAKEFFSDHFAN